MLQQQVYIMNTMLMGLDALCVIAAGYSAYYVGARLDNYQPDGLVFSVSVIAVMFINNYFIGHFNLYSDRAPASSTSLLAALLKAVAISFVVLASTIYLFELESSLRDFLLLFAGSTFVYLAMLRLFVRAYTMRMTRNGFHSRKLLLVGNPDRGRIVSEALKHQLSWGHEIIGHLATHSSTCREPDCLGTIDSLDDILRDQPIDEVVFALQGDRNIDLQRYLEVCRKMGVAARILPALWQPGDHSITVEKCQNIPFLNIHADNFSAHGLLYKRLLDIAGGLVGVLLFFALYPFVALAIKLDSPGPVLFTQVRKGQHGRTFKLYKFRTMHVNAERMKKELMARNEMQGAMFKLADDPRITRVGQWLRKTSIDEFPQFLNVLKGEMSLVGTRPPTIDEVDHYQPEHLRRIAAKPGITGLWQISGRNKINDFEQVVALDCRYLDNWQFVDDIKILLKTVLIVLQRKGAL